MAHKDNSGLAILNSDSRGLTCKTVIVLGMPRGGTSMLAGAVSKLGIFMGEAENLAPFYENPALETCAKQNNKAKAKTIISGYNDRFPAWGLKILPRSWRFWFPFKLFRESVFVVVFRDVLAIAKRRVVSLDKSLIKEMFIASWLNFCLLVFLSMTKRPALILSYEKALMSPDSFVNGLAAFLGIDDATLIEEATAHVKPSPAHYVMQSTTHAQLDADGNYFGYLDRVSPTEIVGWALALSDKNPLQLELVVNGLQKHIIVADALRQDVQKSDARYHGNCGFCINLEENEKLYKGDRVEVKVFEKNIHLINSPFVIS